MISSKTYIAFTKFGIVGGLSFLVDMMVYYAADVFLPSYIAKALGIVIATVVNYKLNSLWTWGVKKGETVTNGKQSVLRNYLLLYAMSGSLNVLTNELMLSTLPDWILQLNVMFPNSEAVTDAMRNKNDPAIFIVLGEGNSKVRLAVIEVAILEQLLENEV